jgi:hypothetical protein
MLSVVKLEGRGVLCVAWPWRAAGQSRQAGVCRRGVLGALPMAIRTPGGESVPLVDHRLEPDAAMTKGRALSTGTGIALG